MQKSNTEIENILNSFNGISRAEANPFLHTKILARLQQENNFWARSAIFITRPVIALACMAAIIFSNLYLVTNSAKSNSQAEIHSASTNIADVVENDTYTFAVNNIDQ